MGHLGREGEAFVISAIGGAAGIGKSSLALYWAHQHADRFPDGQLFVDLRGFDPSGEPMSPAEVIRCFLDALGVNPANIPEGRNAQAGLYRSLVADRRMLIILDNARDTAQVAPLLPGTSTCKVLVTSRRYLSGLIGRHGAQSLDLDILSGTEARQLLAHHLGSERLAAEPDAVTELLCWSAVGLGHRGGSRHQTPHICAARVSMDIGNCPVVVRKTARWWPRDLPSRGHRVGLGV